MAEAPRYQRGEKSSAAAPRDAKRQRTQPFAAQTCMACDGPLAASTAPERHEGGGPFWQSSGGGKAFGMADSKAVKAAWHKAAAAFAERGPLQA
mgnify:CR=1 FL=1